MNAIYTTYTLFYVLYRWPADGQLAKMKIHIVFAWNGMILRYVHLNTFRTDDLLMVNWPKWKLMLLCLPETWNYFSLD